MSQTHVLKVWPQFVRPLLDGRKPWEFRKDDRGFQIGDTLMLQPWSPREFQPGVPEGYINDPAIRATVAWIARGAPIPEGYAILTLADVREATILEDNAAMEAPAAYGIKEGA